MPKPWEKYGPYRPPSPEPSPEDSPSPRPSPKKDPWDKYKKKGLLVEDDDNPYKLTNYDVPQDEPTQEASAQPVGTYDKLKSFGKNLLDSREAYKQGLINAATLNYVPVNEEIQRKHPVASALGKGTGAVGVGALSAMALPEITAGGLIGAGGRIAMNTGLGAGLGGLSKPEEGESRVSNAVHAGLLGGTLGAAGEGIASYGKKAVKWLGGKLGRMSPEAAESYSANPKAAEEIYQQAKSSPMQLRESIGNEMEGALSNVQKNKIVPKVAELNKTMEGKTFKINPEEFKGTSVYDELKSIWNKRVANDTTIAKNPYKMGSEAPMPDDLEISGDDMLRLKRLAFEKAEFNQPKNGIGYSAAETAQAQADSKAGSLLRDHMIKASPKMAELNAEIEQMIRYSDSAKKVGNEAILLNPSDSLGGVANRSQREFLDKFGGSNLESKARQYEAAAQLNRTANSIDKGSAIDSALIKPVAKGLLKSRGLLKSAPKAANFVTGVAGASVR